ncbi:MAG TPA: glycosyltransferase family 9 protein [Candidatus Paceibacterota bacterium]
MDKILIIKIGALGDVVRTTPLLRVLSGEITWITQRNAFPLLRKNPLIHRVVDIQDIDQTTQSQHYDLVINLDEDRQACDLATRLKKREFIGAYSDSDRRLYTDTSSDWFDMGLISKYGKQIADKKKWANQKTYQEILFAMCGKKFNGEEYMLPFQCQSQTEQRMTVGLETRSGERWVAKRWPRFPEFIELLKQQSISFVQFQEFPTLEQFVNRIDTTSVVVTTDSLALHLALALKKKVIALFTCTSPNEIYGYNRLVKIVSPLLEKYFYSTDSLIGSGEVIEPTIVFEALQKLKNDF